MFENFCIRFLTLSLKFIFFCSGKPKESDDVDSNTTGGFKHARDKSEHGKKVDENEPWSLWRTFGERQRLALRIPGKLR
jgi:hypothetical protein